VTICPSCGQETPEGFPRCAHCGAPLEAPPAAREQRKTVTVLFCDVTGSTALGESTDPEALRALLARYFERMKEIIERHGGTVEKFIGDAVMAVFGVPRVHEDDALRACRAAVEMRDALPELGIQARIGVNTGEVVTGTEERLATGDAVNIAARLEQAAQPGRILIGSDTLALVRDAVETEEVSPLELKGKAAPVEAHQLASVLDVVERPHDSAFVGRARELELLQRAWRRASTEERCQLVTVVAEAGVGKSRLIAELLPTIDARIVRGRCLPYGEGITYWPVVEVLRQLDSLPPDPAAAASLRSLLGEDEAGTSPEEIAWAFRKLLEKHAPIVVVFDDIQWGEETYLDLVEHVVLLSSAPILLLCMARPELLDSRPAWPATLRLEPLDGAAVEQLIPAHMTSELRERIARSAGGNPLFITEMVAIAEKAEKEVAVPPTLQALLAARLDQLEPSERRVLECAAVEGEIFHRGAVRALAPDEEQVTARLAALVRRQLVRPDRAQIRGDDGFRFRHLLIRDAAYDALPKSTRAELHERFADWLQKHGADLVELDELLGSHLNRAAHYKAELGRPDAALSERAGAHVATAGRRALWRGDLRGAVPLLEQALELTRSLRFDVHLELMLADAKQVPRKGAAIAEAAADRARERGDQAGEALARVVAGDWRSLFADEPTIDDLERLAQAALPLLEQEEDHVGLARVWIVVGGVANARNHFEAWAEAAEHALRHWRLAGRTNAHAGLPFALVYGPRPADSALEALDSLLGENPHPTVLLGRASLRATLGELEEAWALATPAADHLRELNGDNAGDYHLAQIAALAGDDAMAVHYLRRTCEALEGRGDQAILSTYAPWLGRHLCALGHYDEAERWAERGRELGGSEDVATQMLWRQVLALVHSYRAEHAEAERLAREAVTISNTTDALNAQGDAFCDLAKVLAAAGRTDEAAEALEQALERYERKKNLAMVAQVRPKLEELRAFTS
jgi:class 3 adenylate cyclase/tetratricopeptide (TPR) repeat protein